MKKLLLFQLAVSLLSPTKTNDPTLQLSKSTDISGINKYCNASGPISQGSYICSFVATAALQNYTPGMTLILYVTTSGGTSLNVDGIGPAAIKDSTGIMNVQVSINVPHLIFFDGVNWRVMI